MRIHTDLHAYDVGQIVRTAKCGAWANILTDHGTRTGKRGAVELQLAGTSNRPNASNTESAATWDEWGIVLAAIFEADPTAIMGSAKRPVYADRDDYHWKTGDRFRWLTSSSDDRYHANHTWRWDYVTGSFRYTCKCGAERRQTEAEHGAGLVAPSERKTRARVYVGENLQAGNLVTVPRREDVTYRIVSRDDKALETCGRTATGRSVFAVWVNAYDVTDPTRAVVTFPATMSLPIAERAELVASA